MTQADVTLSPIWWFEVEGGMRPHTQLQPNETITLVGCVLAKYRLLRKMGLLLLRSNLVGVCNVFVLVGFVRVFSSNASNTHSQVVEI